MRARAHGRALKRKCVASERAKKNGVYNKWHYGIFMTANNLYAAIASAPVSVSASDAAAAADAAVAAVATVAKVSV